MRWHGLFAQAGRLMRRLLTPLVVIFALLAWFTGCSSHEALGGVVVELAKIERGSDGALTATLRLDNSTVVAFNIASSTHQVFLDGRLAGTIEITEPLGLPSQQAMTQSARFKLAGGDLPAGSASYRLESSLRLATYGEKTEIHKFSNTGTVQVP